MTYLINNLRSFCLLRDLQLPVIFYNYAPIKCYVPSLQLPFIRIFCPWSVARQGDKLYEEGAQIYVNRSFVVRRFRKEGIK